MATSSRPPTAPPTDNVSVAAAPRPRSLTGSSTAELQDLVFKIVCGAAAVSVLVLFVGLVFVLIRESLPAMRAFGWRFLITDRWEPVSDGEDPAGRLGALAFIYGTLVTSGIAMAIAVPFGLGCAAFLSEIASGWVRRVGAFLIELLAAIPSVVYGFWGVFFLVPAVDWLFASVGIESTDGKGILAAGLILAIMVLPYVTAISFDVCQAVPRSQREGSLSLGATRWQMIWTVILPYARPGIVGGSILALGRALGETMAVVMVIGNQAVIDFSPQAHGYTVASVIANEFNNAQSALKRSALVELALLLLLVTIVVNSLANLLILRLGKGGRSSLLGLGTALWRMAAGAPAQLKTPPVAAEHRHGHHADVAPMAPPSEPYDLTRHTRRAQMVNRLMTGVLGLFLAVTCGPLFLILGYVSYRGLSAFFFYEASPIATDPPFPPLGWQFFTQSWYDTPPGLAHAIYGSGMLVLLATAGAVPIGLLAAIFLAEYRKHFLVPIVRFVGELLGGVPSIIVGILGYSLIVLPMGHFSGWAGAFALGVIMVPIVMRSAEESLRLVPQGLRNASYALGGAYWQTVLRVTLPAALAPIITGILLAMARIAGETAPLLLTASNSNFWTTSPNKPTPYLTYYIYNGALSSSPDEVRLAWAGAFVLLMLVMLINIGVRLLAGKRAVSATRAD